MHATVTPKADAIAPFTCQVANPTSVESRFGMRNCRPRGERSHSDLQLGPWACQRDGRVQSGVIATAADHILGEVVFLRRPPGWWSVTTELSVDFVGAPPPESALQVSAGMTRLEQGGGFAHGTVTDRRGSVVAIGSARAQFVRPHRDVPDVEASPVVAAVDPVATNFDEHLQVAWTCAGDGMHVRMDDPSGWVNEFGILHGGIWACMAEMAASRVIAERNPDLTTSRLHTTFLRSGLPGAPVVTSARVYHVGSRLAVSEVLGRTADGTLCTVSTVTARLADELAPDGPACTADPG